MTHWEAIELIRPGVTRPGTWADLGAGRGTFTLALAELLEEADNVIAVERDATALRALRRAAEHADGARIQVVPGDVRFLSEIPELTEQPLAGALFANVLHFMKQPEAVLAELRQYLELGAQIVVVEYDNRAANRWVPHPIPAAAMERIAQQAGLSSPREVGRRKSRYQGALYCVVMTA